MGRRCCGCYSGTWGGERELWQVVHVPTPTVEDARHASRLVTTLQADRTRARNRIHSLLALHGVRLPIDGRFAARLEAARDWQGDPLPPGVVARVRTTWQLLQALDAVHRGLRRTERAQVQAAAPGASATAHRLVQLRGLAARSATVLAQELFTRTLRNRRQVGALSGLVSGPASQRPAGGGSRAGAERGPRGASHRGRDRVGVATLSTHQCADALVSRPLRER